MSIEIKLESNNGYHEIKDDTPMLTSWKQKFRNFWLPASQGEHGTIGTCAIVTLYMYFMILCSFSIGFGSQITIGKTYLSAFLVISNIIMWFELLSILFLVFMEKDESESIKWPLSIFTVCYLYSFIVNIITMIEGYDLPESEYRDNTRYYFNISFYTQIALAGIVVIRSLF